MMSGGHRTEESHAASAGAEISNAAEAKDREGCRCPNQAQHTTTPSVIYGCETNDSAAVVRSQQASKLLLGP